MSREERQSVASLDLVMFTAMVNRNKISRRITYEYQMLQQSCMKFNMSDWRSVTQSHSSAFKTLTVTRKKCIGHTKNIVNLHKMSITD